MQKYLTGLKINLGLQIIPFAIMPAVANVYFCANIKNLDVWQAFFSLEPSYFAKGLSV